MRDSLSLALALALSACGSDAAPPTSAPPEPPPPTPRWELHEWGLLGFAQGDDAAGLVTVGTGPTPTPALLGHGSGSGSGQAYAPVVYVQLEGDTPEITFDLRVAVARDAVVEAWPGATIDDHGATWTGVHATRATGPCGAVYPSAGDAHCASAGEVCEAATGASYESADGACLAIGDAHADFLLYRARVLRSALPFDVSREGESVRVVAHDGAPAGRVLRIRRSFDDGSLSVASFDAPHAGESVVVPELSAAEPQTTLADLARGMSDESLTAAEIDAFRAAWRDAIVPEDAPTRYPDATRAAIPCGARPAADAIYYWITGATADHLLPLEATPAPTATRRALLVRISLDPPLPGDHGATEP
jgi:hypothetical protein